MADIEQLKQLLERQKKVLLSAISAPALIDYAKTLKAADIDGSGVLSGKEETQMYFALSRAISETSEKTKSVDTSKSIIAMLCEMAPSNPYIAKSLSFDPAVLKRADAFMRTVAASGRTIDAETASLAARTIVGPELTEVAQILKRFGHSDEETASLVNIALDNVRDGLVRQSEVIAENQGVRDALNDAPVLGDLKPLDHKGVCQAATGKVPG